MFQQRHVLSIGNLFFVVSMVFFALAGLGVPEHPRIKLSRLGLVLPRREQLRRLTSKSLVKSI